MREREKILPDVCLKFFQKKNLLKIPSFFIKLSNTLTYENRYIIKYLCDLIISTYVKYIYVLLPT